MISRVRSYINSIITDVDSDFREWKDAFNRDNIPSNIYNKAYHFIYSVPAITKEQALLDYSVSGELNIHYKTDRYPQDDFDSAMNMAEEVGLAISNLPALYQFEISQDNPIYNAQVDSIDPTFPTSNDNRVIVTIQFTMNIKRAIC